MIEKNTLKISSNGKIISLIPHYSYSIDVKSIKKFFVDLS